jgi:hypothetical protein
MPATLDMSAWYAPSTLLIVGAIVALTAWAFYTSLAERLWKKDLFV